MHKLQIHQYPYGEDNYGVLLHSAETGETAAVDTGDAQATSDALKKTGWNLTEIWITHHHADHTAGLLATKAAHNTKCIGPAASSAQIKGIDQEVGDGDSMTFAGVQVDIIATPGHTRDMINFYIPNENLVFTGDTLFVLGCGRLFEETASTMHNSLLKLAKLPAETQVYCSHEYTLANAKFAISVDPNNAALQARIKVVETLRADGKPTVPSTIGDELATNPFMRFADKAIREKLDMQDADDADVLAEIRKRKDNF